MNTSTTLISTSPQHSGSTKIVPIPSTSSSTPKAPLMRAVMRSFSPAKSKKVKEEQRLPPSVDSGKGMDSSSYHNNDDNNKITSSVNKETQSMLSQSQQTEPQESSLLLPRQSSSSLVNHSTSSSPISYSTSTDINTMSFSSPVKCHNKESIMMMETTSHESVDWTNATEATSFSEHDEVVVVETTRLSTIVDDGSVGMDEINAIQAKNNNDDVNVTEASNVDSKSSSSSSSSSSCFTCDTSECAIKVLQRNNNDGDDDDDDDQSWNDLPVVITLINDNVYNTDQGEEKPNETDAIVGSTMSPLTLVSKQQQQQQQQQAHLGGMIAHETTLRLERAEAMLESYRSTLKSNEHLIESLEQTLLETRESAQDLWAERNRLEQELEETLDEQDALISSEKNCFVRRIHTAILGLSLLYFMVGGSEYVLIFVATVYLLEDIMTMCL